MTRPSTAAPILAVLAVVLGTLGAYVGGYLWLGTFFELPFTLQPGGSRLVYREFPERWQRNVFQPAGMVESWLRRYQVHVVQK